MNKPFRWWVIGLVVLTGAGFGTWAGLMYSREIYFWIGTLLGALGGYGAASFYLCRIARIRTTRYNWFVKWLFCTLLAGFCGLVCTTFVHAVMAPAFLIIAHKSLIDAMDGFLLLVMGIAELVGLAAGLVLGGIFSGVYLKIAHRKELMEADSV
jgi:hypothetical protein